MVFDLDSWFGTGLCMWSPMAVVSIPMKWLVALMSLWVLAYSMDGATGHFW